jgi:Spy/CpxP family protein refolding chaperone
MNQPVSRRSAFLTAIAAVLGSTAALTAMTTEAEAKRGGWGGGGWKGGRGRGWAMGRGRKRGWYKRGGPRWWRGF